MPLTREQTKYVTSNDTVFLPTVAIDRNLGVRGTSVFDGTATFNNGLTVNQSASIFAGIINQNSLINGIHAGLGSSDQSPRILFVPPNQTTSANNWQIDVLSGNFRWFTPGILQMSLTPSSLGGTVSTYQILTTGNITSTADNSRIRAVRTTGTAQTTGLGADSGQGFVGSETNTAFQIITNNTARINITAGGDVGIGISPSFPLHVSAVTAEIRATSSTGTNHSRLVLTNTGGSFQYGIDTSTGGTYGFGAYARVLWNDGAHPLVFTTNSAERMRIDSAGLVTIPGGLTITGDLTVNGTTTNINTTNLVIEDKNIILGDVTTPSNTTADGGGITLKGGTDKTFNWVNSTSAFTSSEPIIANSFIPSSATVPTNGMYLSAANTLNLSTASTNRLSISSAGLVTIPGALTVTGTLTATVANATSSANTLAVRQTDGTSLLTPVSPIAVSGSRSTNHAPNTYNYGLFSEFKNTTFGVATVGANYGGLLTYANWDGTTLSTGDPSYQMFFSPVGTNSTSVPFMQIRAGIDTTWGNWGLVQTVTVNTTAKSAAYQLTTADASNIVQMNGAFAFNVNNTLAVLPAGTTITLVAQTAGVTVAANGTATVPTINATPGLKLRAAWSTATLIKMSAASASGSASTWLLTGDLTA